MGPVGKSAVGVYHHVHQQIISASIRNLIESVVVAQAEPSTGRREDVQRKLEISRRELLDFGLRNPLISHRTTAARGVDVTDERPVEVFRILVREGKRMSFNPVPDIEATDSLPQPEPEPGAGPASRHLDDRLQTPYLSSKLQQRLLRTYYDARTSIEEQGVNILFLALGMLEWYEADSTDLPRRAPLLLLPVELERSSALDRFHLVWTGEDPGDNLSAAEKFRNEFGIRFPEMPETESIDLDLYFDELEAAIAGQPRWRVDRQAIVLGFFSFGKFLMYHDLDTTVWPEDAQPSEHPVVGAVLGDNFQEPASSIGDDDFVDTAIADQEIYQVVDADSSQTITIVDALSGRNLVVQGPPGTGKSQTITNIIAEAIGAGKTVLFVAEKMAALEVVKRRLDQVGLGDAALELHSHKLKKTTVIRELQRTLELGKPREGTLGAELSVLASHRKRLNEYCHDVNTGVNTSGRSPFQLYGELVQLRQFGDPETWPRVEVDGIANWDAETWHARLAIVRELQARLHAIGVPAAHPFWGSRKRVVMPADESKIGQATREALDRLGRLITYSAKAAGALGVTAPADLGEVASLLTLLEYAGTAPDAPGVAVTSPRWLQDADRLETLVRSGRQRAGIVERRSGSVTDAAWERDLTDLRVRLVDYRSKWWRGISGGYRAARAELAGYCTGEIPESIEEQVALVDDLIEAQRLAGVVDQYRDTGLELFGPHWRGLQSDWGHLDAWSSWFTKMHRDIQTRHLPAGMARFVESQQDRNSIRKATTGLQQLQDAFIASAATLQDVTVFDTARRFGSPDALSAQPFATLTSLFNSWLDQPARISEMAALNVSEVACTEHDLPAVFDLGATWDDAGTLLDPVVRRARAEALLEAALLSRPSLATFNSDAHQEAIEHFRRLDLLSFQYNRARLALMHWQRLPRNDSAGGQLGVLRREFEKKSRHLPVRRLMERAGNAIQAIKPVFMMSPISIAAYIPPGKLTFDLVIFDEASQVKPVDAFGALLRGKQAVVVGDSRQLPPTSFFESLTDPEEVEEEDAIVQDVESILGLFAASNAPQRMLRWHYRSRHESLITVSNYEFYENRLVLFPSPDRSRENAGLIFRYHPDTEYETASQSKRGAINQKEAEVVARAVIEHALSSPELTLGVAAFSKSQAEVIQEWVERLRREHPEAEAFFSAHQYEPFFVKNLENVQGDERDVIFISVGYGRDRFGKVAMRFGPLNQTGGERRLNVLITRSRIRCEVFTNITADDIRTGPDSPQGVVALKRFLGFAQTGELDIPRETGREPDSPFEEAVRNELVKLGHEVVSQVGAAGFFIDLAIVDPRAPGRFLLAVECDGATYHSARSARDRDRTRQAVLEGLGWKFHRIWSTDWFRNPARELERLELAIQTALASHPDEDAPAPKQVVETAIVREDLEEPIEDSGSPAYQVARLIPHYSGNDLHQTPLPVVIDWVVETVNLESPIHRSEVARRIVEANGAGRLGARIRKHVDRAIATAISRQLIAAREPFLWSISMETPIVRDRQDLPDKARTLAMIAPEEIDEAIIQVVSGAYGIDRPDVPQAVCRLFGIRRATEPQQVIARERIEDLVARGVLEQQGVHLTVASGH